MMRIFDVWTRGEDQPLVLQIKRVIEVVVALCLLICLLPVFPLIALAIKLDSPGPVFFRQMRIGICLRDKTKLFYMIKFRTMRIDAEKNTGAVWAKKGDSRITRVGNFLRKTRLDELPQLINVIKGDMSIIGPRPERPGFYATLENAIPYFSERTYGLLPGITGLAQVNQGYDTCVEDVRSKLAYDLAYSLSLRSISSWLRMDGVIFWKTISVMLLGRGQ